MALGDHPRLRQCAGGRGVERQLKDGPVFSQMHPLEVEVAELLVDLIPCAEMVLAKNGSTRPPARRRARG